MQPTMTLYVSLVSVLISCVFCSIPVTNDNCTYLFDMERNSIKVTCSKNVTVTIRGKGNTKLLTGNDEAMKYWFEANHNAHNNKTTRSGDFNTKAINKLKGANRILRKTKKSLGKRLVALNITSSDLEDGDVKLKNDVEILQRYPPGSIFAHQSIVAAILNQYKYLQMAMLTQNNEMKQLVMSMTSLVSATQKSVRSVMAMGEELQEQLVLLNTALVRCNMSIVNKQKDYCPRILTSIYPSKDKVVKVGIAVGTIMKDPVPAGLYWVTYDYSDVNALVAYKTLDDFELDITQEKRKLPFFCEGTGHTVYKNYFYCQKMMTNKIVRYNLMESRWLGELELPGAGAHNAYPYQSDRFSDIDFATDEYGLWVIYASPASSGNVIISKIYEDNFTIAETWTTLIPKRSVGNTFMICGLLYATDSFSNSPTYIKYIYNTHTGSNKQLKKTDIAFSNTIKNEYVSNYMLDYNPLDRKLYTWNHGRVEIYSTSSSVTDK